MDLNRIIARFAVLADLSIAQTSDFTDICTDSMNHIDSITAITEPSEADISMLEGAAAALSFYKYTLFLMGSGSARGFSAGDFSLDGLGAAADHALALWMQAKKEISHLIRDDDFTFIAT
ncbi:MAG: hypothetical protein ACI4II_10215 [Acutalibacteraceae bacterium]